MYVSRLRYFALHSRVVFCFFRCHHSASLVIRCGSIERRGRCTITASHDPDQGLLYAVVVASVVWAASKKQGRKQSLITIRSIRTLKGAGTPLCGAHELNVRGS